MTDTATPHTDFVDQQKFSALSTEDKLLEIWLNGRETNGHVADALRDISSLKTRVDDVESYQAHQEQLVVKSAAVRAILESWWTRASVVVVFLASIAGNTYNLWSPLFHR